VKKNDCIGYLIEVVTSIKEDGKLVNKIKKGLKEYKILPGKIQGYFNNPDLLWEVDIATVYLIIEQVYLATENPKIKPSEYFTLREIKEIKTNFTGAIRKGSSSPLLFTMFLRERKMIISYILRQVS
jgi:hypothetical protein